MVFSIAATYPLLVIKIQYILYDPFQMPLFFSEAFPSPVRKLPVLPVMLLLHFSPPLSSHPLLQGKGGVATAPALEQALSLLHKRLPITCLLN